MEFRRRILGFRCSGHMVGEDGMWKFWVEGSKREKIQRKKLKRGKNAEKENNLKKHKKETNSVAGSKMELPTQTSVQCLSFSPFFFSFFISFSFFLFFDHAKLRSQTSKFACLSVFSTISLTSMSKELNMCDHVSKLPGRFLALFSHLGASGMHPKPYSSFDCSSNGPLSQSRSRVSMSFVASPRHQGYVSLLKPSSRNGPRFGSQVRSS